MDYKERRKQLNRKQATEWLEGIHEVFVKVNNKMKREFEKQ